MSDVSMFLIVVVAALVAFAALVFRRPSAELMLDHLKAERGVSASANARAQAAPVEVPACRVSPCKAFPEFPMVVIVPDTSIIGRLTKGYTVAFDYTRPNQLCANHKRKQQGILQVEIARMREALARTEADNCKRALLSEEGAVAISKQIDTLAVNQAIAGIDQYRLTDGKTEG